jgi:hypothetical protein
MASSCNGIPVGVLVCHQFRDIESIHKSIPPSWRRTHGVTSFISTRGGETSHEIAVHVTPEAAFVLNGKSGDVPAALLTLLEASTVRWVPGIRIFSPECWDPASTLSSCKSRKRK